MSSSPTLLPAPSDPQLAPAFSPSRTFLLPNLFVKLMPPSHPLVAESPTPQIFVFEHEKKECKNKNMSCCLGIYLSVFCQSISSTTFFFFCKGEAIDDRK